MNNRAEISMPVFTDRFHVLFMRIHDIVGDASFGLCDSGPSHNFHTTQTSDNSRGMKLGEDLATRICGKFVCAGFHRLMFHSIVSSSTDAAAVQTAAAGLAKHLCHGNSAPSRALRRLYAAMLLGCLVAGTPEVSLQGSIPQRLARGC
jgi:hypothetical protein